jgi:hypothetical protein
MCEGWSLEIGMALHGSVVRRDRGGEPARWIASINSSALGEFLEREIANRVEELIEASMMLVLHDWELYRATKAKRQCAVECVYPPTIRNQNPIEVCAKLGRAEL